MEWTTLIVAYAVLAGSLGGVLRLQDFPRVKLCIANIGEMIYAVVSSIIMALVMTWFYTEQMGIDVATFPGFIAVALSSMAGIAGIRAVAELPVVKAILASTAPAAAEEEGGVVDQNDELVIEPK